MNNEEKILAILETMQSEIVNMQTKVDDLQINQKALRAEQKNIEIYIMGANAGQEKTQTYIKALQTDMEDLKEQQRETHNNLINLENTMLPLVKSTYDLISANKDNIKLNFRTTKTRINLDEY